MNSTKVFNNVIMYIEKTISDGGDIDYAKISMIAASPAALFQRIFIFVSGISMSDYIRKRKLSLAGCDLREGDISVLDVAVKYGFRSHSAFSRAFKEHHGITPSEAKKSKLPLNIHHPIDYSDMRFIGGKRIMAEMKKIEYRQIEERKAIGYYRSDASFFNGGEIWKTAFGNGTFEKLERIGCCADIEPNDGIGYMYGFRDMNNFELIIGKITKSDTTVPDGLAERIIPAGSVACVQVEGKDIREILESAYLLITEAVEKTGRLIDFENFYWCEVYTHERYCEPLNQGMKVIIDYIVPVKEI